MPIFCLYDALTKERKFRSIFPASFLENLNLRCNSQEIWTKWQFCVENRRKAKGNQSTSNIYLTGHLPMSQKVVQTQNRQFPRNLCQSTLPWSKLTTQNISGLRIWGCCHSQTGHQRSKIFWVVNQLYDRVDWHKFQENWRFWIWTTFCDIGRWPVKRELKMQFWNEQHGRRRH